MGQVTEMIVVRHGESMWNRQERLQGQAESELSPLGVRQARALGQRLAGESFAALVSSDLGRARQTAEAIAERSGHAVVLDAALRERHFGIFQGHTWEQIRTLFPAEHQAYWRGPDYAPPGGETAHQRHERVLAALERIALAHAGQRLVIVTHGGPLMGLFKHAVGLDCQSPRQFSLCNAALNVFTIGGGRWKLQCWGDTRHLAGLSAADDY